MCRMTLRTLPALEPLHRFTNPSGGDVSALALAAEDTNAVLASPEGGALAVLTDPVSSLRTVQSLLRLGWSNTWE